MFGADTADWILQEDNDQKHRSRLCTAWKTENGITTLDWPSQSPDANPIENVRWKISGKHAEKVPDHSGQRWGLDYLLGSSAVVLREYFYL